MLRVTMNTPVLSFKSKPTPPTARANSLLENAFKRQNEMPPITQKQVAQSMLLNAGYYSSSRGLVTHGETSSPEQAIYMDRYETRSRLFKDEDFVRGLGALLNTHTDSLSISTTDPVPQQPSCLQNNPKNAAQTLLMDAMHHVHDNAIRFQNEDPDKARYATQFRIYEALYSDDAFVRGLNKLVDDSSVDTLSTDDTWQSDPSRS